MSVCLLPGRVGSLLQSQPAVGAGGERGARCVILPFFLSLGDLAAAGATLTPFSCTIVLCLVFPSSSLTDSSRRLVRALLSCIAAFRSSDATDASSVFAGGGRRRKGSRERSKGSAPIRSRAARFEAWGRGRRRAATPRLTLSPVRARTSERKRDRSLFRCLFLRSARGRSLPYRCAGGRVVGGRVVGGRPVGGRGGWRAANLRVCSFAFVPRARDLLTRE